MIFEYSRCFFTPYKLPGPIYGRSLELPRLDDKRKNCNSKKHQTEDLMCPGWLDLRELIAGA